MISGPPRPLPVRLAATNALMVVPLEPLVPSQVVIDNSIMPATAGHRRIVIRPMDRECTPRLASAIRRPSLLVNRVSWCSTLCTYDDDIVSPTPTSNNIIVPSSPLPPDTSCIGMDNLWVVPPPSLIDRLTAVGMTSDIITDIRFESTVVDRVRDCVAGFISSAPRGMDISLADMCVSEVVSCTSNDSIYSPTRCASL